MQTSSKNRRIKIAAAVLVALGVAGAASFGFIASRSGEETTAGAAVEPTATATATPSSTPAAASAPTDSPAATDSDSNDGATADAPAAPPPPTVTPVPPLDEPEVEPTVTPEGGCPFCPEDLGELAQPEDETAPVISDVEYELCTGTLEISFSTDEQASAWITYNDGEGQGLTIEKHGTSFEFTVGGLAMGTTVHFWVHVADEHGNHTATHYSLFSMACLDVILNL